MAAAMPSFSLSRPISSHIGVGIGATIALYASDKLMGPGTLPLQAAVYAGAMAGIVGSVISDVLLEKPLMGILGR